MLVVNAFFEPISQCVSRYTATRLVIIIIISVIDRYQLVKWYHLGKRLTASCVTSTMVKLQCLPRTLFIFSQLPIFMASATTDCRWVQDILLLLFIICYSTANVGHPPFTKSKHKVALSVIVPLLEFVLSECVTQCPVWLCCYHCYWKSLCRSLLDVWVIDAWWLSSRVLDLWLTGRGSIPGRSAFT